MGEHVKYEIWVPNMVKGLKRYRSKNKALKSIGLSQPQDLMFTLCNSPDKKNCKKLSITCTIECFNVNNPDFERALKDKNSPEYKIYSAKLQPKYNKLG